MECIISDGLTFKTKTHGTAISYELITESVQNKKSIIKVSRDKYDANIDEGDIASMGAYCGVVTNTTTDDLTAEIECEHITTLFDRALTYTERAEGSLEAYLKEQIDANFTNQSDPYYQSPNLVVIAETDTISGLEPDAEDGTWNIMGFIAKVRRVHNIHTTVEMKRDSLIVRIGRREVAVKNLDLSDPKVKVIEEAYSNNVVGKVSCYIESLRETGDWYLLEGGTITDDPDAEGRVSGKWERTTAAKVRNVEGAVKEVFAQNEQSHKLCFSVLQQNARFEFYDQLRTATKGKILYTHVTSIKTTKGSDRIEYQCGQMRATLSDDLVEDL